MSVKLHEVMGAVQQRAASLAAEVAGYLVLAAADQVSGAPRAASWDDVALMEDGSVRVVSGTPADDAESERALRSLLAQMLLEASSVTPSLLRAAHKASGAGVETLIQEIEAALVPVNRGAARRALSRLHRDVTRAKDSGTLEDYQPAAMAEPVAEPAPVERTFARPSQPSLEHSVDLSTVLSNARETASVPSDERGSVSPVAPAARDTAVDSAWGAADELETAIPVYVEMSEPSPPVAVAAERPMPEVPDLEVPPSPAAPRAQATEVATAPQPAVVRARRGTLPPPFDADRRSAMGTDGRTPPLGTCTTELEPPPWPLEVSEPIPAVLELAGEDATERMPTVVSEENTAPLPSSARRTPRPASAAARDEALATWDPPAAAPVNESSAASIASEPAPIVTPEPSPVPSVIAARRAAARQPEPSPPPPPPVDVYTLPRRPARAHPAPPRYAPRKSDVEELLSGFSVATTGTDRELCSDLKSLAGVDATRPPPEVELCETPPPVAVEERALQPEPGSTGERSSARVAAGAVTAAVLVAAMGLGNAAVRSSGATAAAGPPAAVQAAPAPLPSPVRIGQSVKESTCVAELTVRRLPASARTRLRAGPDAQVISPSRLSGNEAVFEGLPCSEGVEVTVELPGRGRWLRVPVSADDLAPSAEEPSFVRHSVYVR